MNLKIKFLKEPLNQNFKGTLKPKCKRNFKIEIQQGTLNYKFKRNFKI